MTQAQMRTKKEVKTKRTRVPKVTLKMRSRNNPAINLGCNPPEPLDKKI